MSSNYSVRPISLVTPAGSVQIPADALVYEPYFRLNEKPFSLNADSRFIYESPSYRSASQGLLAGIRRREGLLVLTGEIGTGKTTLCRGVLQQLGRNTYSSLVPDPFASREDLLKMALVDFGVVPIQEVTTGSLRHASRTELGYLLAQFLHSLPADAFVVIVIDEAQNLSLSLIEETRLLSDTFGSRGRLQIVFVGQPELLAKLKLPEMRQVDQRVCGYHRLTPMDREAVGGYIQHRLKIAGLRQDRVLFPDGIIDVLHPRSGGVPRLINRVCDRALQIAFERQELLVGRETLDTALIEIGAATLSPTWDSIVLSTPAATLAAPPAAKAAPAPFREEPLTPPPAPFRPEPVAPAPAPVRPEPAAPATALFRPEPVAPAPAAPAPAPAVRQAPATEDDGDDFTRQVDKWVEKDLAPPRKKPLHQIVAEDGLELPALTKPAKGAARPIVPRTDRPSRRVVRDWPDDVRSETYLRRLARKVLKGIAIAAATLVVVSFILAGVSMVGEALSPAVLPSLPEAPVRVLPAAASPVAINQ